MNITLSLFYNRLHLLQYFWRVVICIFVKQLMMKRLTAKHDKPYFAKPVRCNDSTFHWIERGFLERPEKRNKHKNDGNCLVIYDWNFNHEEGKQATSVVARKGWEALFIRINSDADNSRKQKPLIYAGTFNLQPNQYFSILYQKRFSRLDLFDVKVDWCKNDTHKSRR